MQAGELHARVGFFMRPASGDSPDYGNPEADYPDAPEFECSANIRPRLGGESVLAGRLSGTNLVNITVRQSTLTRDVTEAWKVRDMRSGVDYNIRSIIDPEAATAERGRWFELLCEKGAAV